MSKQVKISREVTGMVAEVGQSDHNKHNLRNTLLSLHHMKTLQLCWNSWDVTGSGAALTPDTQFVERFS